MTENEAKRLWRVINGIKREWRIASEEEDRLTAGKTVKESNPIHWRYAPIKQAFRDSLFHIIYQMHLKLEINMLELPANLDLRKLVRKGGEVSTSTVPHDELTNKIYALV